jgi:hypothetical protein
MAVAREVLKIAREVVWFMRPEEAVADRDFFLAHVMTYGTVEDVVTAKKYFTSADFRHALEHAPPGVFDARSWNYWNLVLGREPVPPLPKRKFIAER